MIRRFVSDFLILGDFLWSDIHDILWSFAKYNLYKIFKFAEY
jgi:hypothetical protein